MAAPHGTRWANIDAVVDNGAAKLVAPLDLGPHATVLQSEEANRQHTFASAISGKLPNLGGKLRSSLVMVKRPPGISSVPTSHFV